MTLIVIRYLKGHIFKEHHDDGAILVSDRCRAIKLRRILNRVLGLHWVITRLLIVPSRTQRALPLKDPGCFLLVPGLLLARYVTVGGLPIVVTDVMPITFHCTASFG